MNEISGPYEFGDQPPVGLYGWMDRIWKHERDQHAACLTRFRLYGATADKPPATKIWEWAKRVNGGQHLPVGKQETGDCVSWGVKQAGQYLQCYEIAKKGQEEDYHEWFAPFIYGVSRVQVGRDGGGGAGSTGVWGARAVKDYGVLFADDAGVPTYSGRVADAWGRRPGPPPEFLELAKDNPIKAIAPLTSVSQIREALINRKMVTIASMRGFQMQPVSYRGYHVFKPQGRWPHQMCGIEWMDDPFPAMYRLNSWGPGAHGTPLNGEPPGGAWNRAEDIEVEMRSGDVEAYALSSFDGWPGEPDYGVL